MNWVHVHLMTNHIPVIGVFIGLAILAYAMFQNSTEMKRFSLGYFVLLSLVTVLVYFTGEPAEEAIEQTPGVVHSIVETHENASIWGLVSVLVLGLTSLGAFIFRKMQLTSRPGFYRLVLALTIVSCGTMAWIANLGGKIRHSEIQPAEMAGEAAPEESSPGSEESNRDEWDIDEISGEEK